ncbi:helix-turn-helix domain-containing protein [Spirosoma flavus]
MITNIQTEADYRAVQAEVEAYLQKATQGGGFASLSEQDDQELLRLSHLMRAYEQLYYPMPSQPQTLAGMIELKMFERKLKQKDLAELLEVEAPRVSELLRGKRRLSLEMARQLYKKLGISAEFILEHA